jgi:cell division septum initiation protein DivIVA
MGDPQINGGDSGTRVETADAAREADRPVRRWPSSRVLSSVDRERMLADARTTEFPSALRGYDRVAVDRYVEKVNRLLTELEMSSSPEAAVKHALDEVSDETREILQHAHQTAEEITARSRQKADDRLQRAEAEARELREAAQAEAQELRETAQSEALQLRQAAQTESHELRQTASREAAELRERTAKEVKDLRETALRETQQHRAEAERDAEQVRADASREAEELLQAAESRARELARNAETIWRERRRLIDDMRGVGEQLMAIGEVEGKRFAQPPGDGLPVGAETVGAQTPIAAEEREPQQA